MANPVVHFEILGKDGGKSREFYKKLFDWQFQMFESGGGDYGVVTAGAEKNAIGGGVGAAMPETGPMVTIYMQVDNVKGYLDKALSLGAKTVTPETPIPGIGSFALFKDLDGNVLGLFKPVS